MTLRDATRRGDRGSEAYTTSEEALVTRLQALSADLAVGPDDDYRAATRARLVAMAAVRTPAAEASTRRPPVRAGRLRRLLAGSPSPADAHRRTRLTAGLAGAALTVTALGGLFAAASGAHPGDLLYDLKRGGEQTELTLAGDSRGLTLLGFASTRLGELQDLVGVQPNADPVVGSTPSGGGTGLAAGPDVGLVLDTLQTMDAQTTEGTAALTARAVQESDADALGVLAGWTAAQQSGLGDLVGAVPAGAEEALAAARELVGQVAARGAALQGALDCAGGPATAGTDRLGPVPTACPAAPGTTVAAPGPGTTSVPDVVPDTVPGPVPAGTAGQSSSAAAGPAAPAPTSGTAPTTAGPGAPTSGVLPPTVAPPTSTLPRLPLPSIPRVPLPSVPLPTPTAAPTSSAGALVSVPPVVPRVSVCVPPLITVGC